MKVENKKKVDELVQRYLDAAAELYLLIEEYGDVDSFEIEVWGRKQKYTIGVR